MVVYSKVSLGQNDMLVCENMINSLFLLNILYSQQLVWNEYTSPLEHYSVVDRLITIKKNTIVVNC